MIYLYPILKKLSTGSVDETVQAILNYYQTHGSVVVNYLYGANIVKYKLLDQTNNPYKSSLLESDFVLPDGIALRTLWMIWYWCGIIDRPSTIYNLNGTDFVHHILDYVSRQSHVHLSIYCNYDHRLQIGSGMLIAGSRRYLDKMYHIKLSYAVDRYYHGQDTRNWSDYDASVDHGTKLKIILICTGTPHQELWIHTHRQAIADRGCIVLAQGGTLDFWTGQESRAPLWIRNLHLEFFYRLIANPRKNWKKVLISLMMIWIIISHPIRILVKKMLCL